MSPEHPDYWRSLIRMGLTKFFMLRALFESPLHGYDLAGRVEVLSAGVCSPTWATIYPTLKEWEKANLVYSYWETVRRRRRRVYALTDNGKEAFHAALGVWEPAAEAVLRMPVVDREELANHLL